MNRTYRIDVLVRMTGRNDGMDKEGREKPFQQQKDEQRRKGRLQKGKKKKKLKKRLQRREFGKELSSMDYFVLCAKPKNTKEALTEAVSAPLLFSRQSTEASAEMCFFSIYCNRNATIVSLTNQHSKMSFWGKRSVSSPWKKTLCTHSIFLCMWANLTGCLCFCPPSPFRLKICQDVSDIAESFSIFV